MSEGLSIVQEEPTLNSDFRETRRDLKTCCKHLERCKGVKMEDTQELG